MNRIKIIFQILLATLLFTLPSCRDDVFDFEIIGEGEATVSMNVVYQPFVSALDTRSPGTAISGGIKSLSVLVYTTDHTLYKVFNRGDLENWDYKEFGNTDMPNGEDGKPEGTSTEKTARVSFDLPEPLPFGRYRIYCVVNQGDITTEEAKDINKIKERAIAWQPDNIPANDAMFGFFTQSQIVDTDDEPAALEAHMKSASSVNGAATGFDAGIVTLKEPRPVLHAWVKRLASKVTVAFDGTGLHQNVWVYVKSVTIHDIPKRCYLGKDNTPTSTSQLYNVKGEALQSNSILYFHEKNRRPGADVGDTNDPGSDYHNWMRVANGLGDDKGLLGSDHSNNANALFFFENNQGNYEGQAKYDKRQDKGLVGTNVTTPGQPDYKDNVPNGTYIEVEAYYVSSNVANTSSGSIKYRFMLGKDITYDYNAARSHHFKVTLGFKGWANQPDWHIEYWQPDPDLDVEDTRVSYLYNQKSTFPIKLTGNCTSLSVKIVENCWTPCDSLGNPAPAQLGSGLSAWRWSTTAGGKYTGTAYPYLGFLALRVPGAKMSDVPSNIIDNYDYSKGTTALNALKKYYETEQKQNIRTFTASELSPTGGDGKGGYEAGTNNAYQVHKIDTDTKMVLIPLFTRNKSMIKTSGYSGNNPYEAYYRKAVLEITAEFNNDGVRSKITKRVNVMQVPRITNPKGIWRSHDKSDGFNVVLSNPATGDATTYSPFESDGYWKAYIEIKGEGSSFASLYTTQPESKTYMNNDTVMGNTSTIISFGVAFNGAVGESESKCAVIRIDYHGGNCVHRILVRKGLLSPIAISGNTKWSSFCLYGAKYVKGTDGSDDTYDCELTVNPLGAGSFFRRGIQSTAILSANDKINHFKAYQAPGSNRMQVWTEKWSNNKSTTPSTSTWDSIGFRDDRNKPKMGMGFYTTFGKIGTSKRMYRVPTYQDLENLRKQDYGFGVLYGDGATTTQLSRSVAEGFFDPLNNTKESIMGSRGVFIYNQNNGNQIFFPIGVTGMGRRRMFNFYQSNIGANYASYYGSLWYADVNAELPIDFNANTDKPAYKNQFRPIVFNLPAAPGAIYWIDKWVSKSVTGNYNSMGWDMNYYNFDFNNYTENNYRDGCYIKLIYTGDAK